MTVILILAGSLLLTGTLLWLHHRYGPQPQQGDDSSADGTSGSMADGSRNDDSECCGMHITCERDSLLASVSATIEYYDDEELDRYAGRRDDEYSDDEIEEFRDVLITMRPDDIAGWARSLQLRGITLPSPIRDELLMIVAEARNAK